MHTGNIFLCTDKSKFFLSARYFRGHVVSFNMNLGEEERHPFIVSIVVIVLAILAIAAFIISGGSVFFYIFALLALIAGIYLAYVIPKEAVTKESVQQKQVRKPRKS